MGLNLPKQEPCVFVKAKGDERKRIVRMRMALVMGSPFYGLLAMKLKLVENPAIKTAGTEGKHLTYNPEYVAGMSDAKLKGLIGHETLHCVMGHMWRKGTREHRLWNVSTDYAIDEILQRNGFDVPNALVNPAWKGWSAEQIYAALLEEVEKEKQKQQQQKGNGQPQAGESGDEEDGCPNDDNEADKAGKGKPSAQKGEQPGGGEPGEGEGEPEQGGGGSSYQQALDQMFGPGPTKGEVMDAPAETALQDQSEWKQAVSAAAQVAKSQGMLPADLEIIVNKALETRVDWKAVLRRFVQHCARLDYSWRSPSSRYAPLGLYLPKLRSETMPPIVIAVDTSGSIGGKELEQFSGEVSSIIEEANPEVAHLVFCDAKVHGTEEFLPGDPIKFKPSGGGGTDFRPVFQWIEEQGIEPACLIYLTDLYGTCPDEEPPYPTIWASTTDPEKAGNYLPKFGEVLHLDFE